MSNNMNLIMENWRKFSKEVESLDKSKVLIETSKYNGNLKLLLSEQKNKKISKNQFNKIICESIERDTEELNKILFEYSKIKSSKLITEAEADQKKQSLFNTAIEKIKNIAVKTKEVIDTAFMQPIFLKNNIENALKQFGKENPKTAQALKTAGKIAVFAGLGMALAHYLDGSSAMASDLVNMSDIKDLENYRTYLTPDSLDGSQFWDWVGRHASDFQGADQLSGQEIIALKKQANISPKTLVKIAKYLAKYLRENTIEGIDSGNSNVNSILDATGEMRNEAIGTIDKAAAKAAGYTRDADFNIVPTGGGTSQAADAATSAVSQAADAASRLFDDPADFQRFFGNIKKKQEIISKLKEIGLTPEEFISNSESGLRKLVSGMLKNKEITKQVADRLTNMSGSYANVVLKGLGAIK